MKQLNRVWQIRMLLHLLLLSLSAFTSRSNALEIIYDGNIRSAVVKWTNSKRDTELQFGPIEYWDTSRVTTLFKGKLIIVTQDFRCTADSHTHLYSLQGSG